MPYQFNIFAGNYKVCYKLIYFVTAFKRKGKGGQDERKKFEKLSVGFNLFFVFYWNGLE
jgi:hypothetical protein